MIDINTSIAGNVSTNNNAAGCILAINNRGLTEVSNISDVAKIQNGQKNMRSHEEEDAEKRRFDETFLRAVEEDISSNPGTQSASCITTRQARLFRALIRKQAHCLGISPQKLHNRLKRTFNYHSYQNLTPEAYEKIIAYLRDICPGS